jgi:hypothetical protein
MKISVKALYKNGGIGCALKRDKGTPLSARIAYVTQSTVSAARALADTDASMRPGDGDPDVTYGAIVAVVRNEDGTTSGRVIPPGETEPFVLRLDGEDFGLTGTDMLALREAIVARTREGKKLSRDAMRALGGVQEIFEMVSSAPDTERFPASLIAQAYHASMIDAFGDVDLPIDNESFVRKSRADLIRARIGMLDPSHADAMTTAAPLRGLLEDAGIKVSANGVCAEVRHPELREVNEEAIRRTILADERLHHDVFGAVTATPVEKLSAAMIPLDGLSRLRAAKKAHRLSGEWVGRLATRVRSIIQDNQPKAKFDIEVFSEKGRDIMAISDAIGQQAKVAWVYSWPSADRIPVMEVAEGRILNISPEDVPSEEEVKRLTKALGQIEALNLHDQDFEMRERFDG